MLVFFNKSVFLLVTRKKSSTGKKKELGMCFWSIILYG